MVDTTEIRAIAGAAERAATAGDYLEAGRLLAQVAGLQEAERGPEHPDLANTLNNLGVVYERTGELDRAEQCYRRAHAIATAALGPEDPLTITSGQNLEDFCAAQDRPVERVEPVPAVPPPAPPPAVAGPPAGPAPPASAAPPAPSAAPAARSLDRSSVALSGHPRRFPLPAAGAILVLLVAAGVYFVYGTRTADEQSARPDTPPATVTAPVEPPGRTPPQAAPPVPATPSAAETVASAASANATTAPATPVPSPRAVTGSGRPARGASPEAALSVVDAQLCRSLSTVNWACTPVSGAVPPGTLYYYTRLTSDRDTSVRHRWYFNGGLMQDVSLKVGRNQGAGYRTYSRNTIIAERSGNWRVELRDAAGTVLDQKSFTVSGRQ